jgi:KDO2-lipid IV(A) lauroyltransferase
MFHLVYGLLYLISLLPFAVLYIISDIFYLFIYYVIGYRKDVVMMNLKFAFPEKTEKERTDICKRFYKNLVDTYIETIKFISISPEAIKKHFEFDGTIINKINAERKRCQAHLGHNFNWELAIIAVPLYCNSTYIDIYLPIDNKFFDRLLFKIRSRTGAVLINAHEVNKGMLPFRNVPYLISLVADQNPPNPSRAIWFNFLGRPAPFMKGAEVSAKRGNIPVVFCHITKLRRGYYKGHTSLATTNPVELPDGELTRMYVKHLEATIKEQPDMWLWSHRRWKHQWKEEYGPVKG